MENLLKQIGLVGCAFLYGACASQLPLSTRQPTRTPQTIDPTITPSSPQPDTFPLKLTLTLGSLMDLKVKPGDQVVKGQVLADPTSTRQDLERQRDALQEKLVVLNAPPAKPVEAKDTVFETQVQNARQRLQLAEVAIEKFYQDSPYTDYARETLALPEEELQLATLEAERDSAKAQLKQAEQQLQTAQSISSLPSIPPVTDQNSLLKQLTAIDSQLKDLKTEVSPHHATVQAVDLVESKNAIGKLFQVEVTLAVQPALPVNGSAQENPRGRPAARPSAF